ncbi:MAG: hypothetical protein FWF54_06330 [Candidatus Azobacteroides sp.]|nr:hypothetical protein [Candidatus Azobacteroides sp.]
MNRNYFYEAKSDIWNALIKGRLKLVFVPDFIRVDLEKEEIKIEGNVPYHTSLNDIIGADITYHKRCADINIDTSDRIISVRCVRTCIAEKMKNLIDGWLYLEENPNTR